MLKIIAIDGVLCAQRGGEIVGFFERGGDGWSFVMTDGNGAGRSDSYDSLQKAFNRAQRFTPWSNEGTR